MALWHVAAILFLFRWIFRDPKVDVRFLALGALLPDIIDLSVTTVVGGFETGELYAHSLLIPSLFMILVLLVTRRGRLRRAWFALGVAWLFHLVIDGMWAHDAVLFWPFLGELPQSSASFWPAAWERAFSDPWRWILEAGGLGYLVWVWTSSGPHTEATRRRLIHEGRLA